MHSLSNAVSTNRILERILTHLPDHTYLVGGCIRDLLLGVEPFDFDLVTFGSPKDLAGSIEGILGGTAFLIDRERGVFRIAINHGEYTLDISPARGTDIGEDLKERDITVNAMACRPAGGGLVDPLQGVSDLQAKRIRLIGEKNLLDDPLRGLRCLRFAVQLGFSTDEHTMRLIRKHARTLAGVAPERIKHEFLRALSGPRGAGFFLLLDKSGYVRVIFGHEAKKTTTAFSPEAVMQADRVLEEAEQLLPGVGLHFSEELEHGMSRRAAFRLAAFLFPEHGYQPPEGKVLSGATRASLALSAKARKTINGAIEGACRVIALKKGARPTGSEMYRLLDDHDGHIPEMLLLAMASGMAEQKGVTGPVECVSRELWDFFLDQYRMQKAGPLLSGRDILQIPGITPGAIVGKMLRLVEDARADGLVSSRREAFSFLRKRVQR